jgi:hypothetical protein
MEYRARLGHAPSLCFAGKGACLSTHGELIAEGAGMRQWFPTPKTTEPEDSPRARRTINKLLRTAY